MSLLCRKKYSFLGMDLLFFFFGGVGESFVTSNIRKHLLNLFPMPPLPFFLFTVQEVYFWKLPKPLLKK